MEYKTINITHPKYSTITIYLSPFNIKFDETYIHKLFVSIEDINEFILTKKCFNDKNDQGMFLLSLIGFIMTSMMFEKDLIKFGEYKAQINYII